MKRHWLLNLIIAITIYSVILIIANHWLFEGDTMGLGGFYYFIFHCLLQILLFGISLSIMVFKKKGYFSIISFLSLILNLITLIFLPFAYKAFDKGLERNLFIFVAFSAFFIHFYGMFQKSKTAKTT